MHFIIIYIYEYIKILSQLYITRRNKSGIRISLSQLRNLHFNGYLLAFRTERRPTFDNQMSNISVTEIIIKICLNHPVIVKWLFIKLNLSYKCFVFFSLNRIKQVSTVFLAKIK